MHEIPSFLHPRIKTTAVSKSKKDILFHSSIIYPWFNNV